MKRQTRDEIQAALDHERRDATVTVIALSAIAGGETPAATSGWNADGWDVTATLYRALSGHGGIVVRVARLAGQRPQVDALYLDDYGAEGKGWVLEDLIAAERLRVVRQCLWDTVRSRQELNGETLGVAIQAVTA